MRAAGAFWIRRPARRRPGPAKRGPCYYRRRPIIAANTVPKTRPLRAPSLPDLRSPIAVSDGRPIRPGAPLRPSCRVVAPHLPPSSAALRLCALPAPAADGRYRHAQFRQRRHRRGGEGGRRDHRPQLHRSTPRSRARSTSFRRGRCRRASSTRRCCRRCGCRASPRSRATASPSSCSRADAKHARLRCRAGRSAAAATGSSRRSSRCATSPRRSWSTCCGR